MRDILAFLDEPSVHFAWIRLTISESDSMLSVIDFKNVFTYQKSKKDKKIGHRQI
jgi:hypothetical protein